MVPNNLNQMALTRAYDNLFETANALHAKSDEKFLSHDVNLQGILDDQFLAFNNNIGSILNTVSVN